MSPDLLAEHPPLPDCALGCGRDATIRYGNLILCATCALQREGHKAPSIRPLPKIDRAKALRGFAE